MKTKKKHTCLYCRHNEIGPPCECMVCDFLRRQPDFHHEPDPEQFDGTDGSSCAHEWGEAKGFSHLAGAVIRYCRRCGIDSIRAARIDGTESA